VADEIQTARREHEPVVAVLEEEFDALVGLGRELRDGEFDVATACPGWTVRDVFSHLVGIERTLLGDPEPPALEVVPPHVRNPLGARNEAWVASRRALPGAAVVAEFAAVATRRLEQLRGMPTERFDQVGPSPAGEMPYREFMHVRVMDCWVHEQDIRLATHRPGHRHGPPAAMAVDRLAAALPYVVARKAAAPEGSRVRFEVGGAISRRIEVAVRSGRGVVVSPMAEPTCTLRLDAEAFWRLTCGRVPAAAALAEGLVQLSGDQRLASAVLGAMAFMI